MDERLNELLTEIDENQKAILAQGPLNVEVKKKLNYRIRLDWNYHSNVMEGSSLTRLETQDIMMGQAVAKPWKDVQEMKGHDEQIRLLLDMSKGQLELSESRIKAIHCAIVHEDDPELKAQIGQWKQQNNYIYNHRGERFDFTPKDEVPEAMHKLLDTIKADVERIERDDKAAPHPILIASRLHREMVTIHPFHDGNGRMSRIMCNILLMRLGYSPLVIETSHKDEYNRILGEIQGDGAPEILFDMFIAARVIEAQQLMLTALAGKSLERADDVDKEIDLFERKLKGGSAKVQRSHQAISDVFNESLGRLFDLYEKKQNRFDSMFFENEFVRTVDRSHPIDISRRPGHQERIVENSLKEPLPPAFVEKTIERLGCISRHRQFKETAPPSFDIQQMMTAIFSIDQYHLTLDYNRREAKTYSYSYNHILTDNEILEIVNDFIKQQLAELREKSGTE